MDLGTSGCLLRELRDIDYKKKIRVVLRNYVAYLYL